MEGHWELITANSGCAIGDSYKCNVSTEQEYSPSLGAKLCQRAIEWRNYLMISALI